MELINIEYGSIASSETMNKNFAYLNDRISEVSTSLNTVIASILSNIATINSRLSEIAGDIQNDAESFNSKLNDFKTKSRLAFNKLSMLPNWSNCFVLTDAEKNSYTVPKNGYLLLNPKVNSKGTLSINGKTVTLKSHSVSSDNASQLYFIPVKTGDIASCTLDLDCGYFLPVVEISTGEL